MEIPQEHDLDYLKQLLRHAGEFIAYFDVADQNMLEWRTEIEQKRAELASQTQQIQQEILALKALFGDVGINKFQLTAEKALSQGEAHVHAFKDLSQQLVHTMEQQQIKLNEITKHCISQIEQRTIKSSEVLSAQLAKYDVQQFHRIANESCNNVERAAHNAINKSNKLLDVFQLRFGLFAIITTICTAFLIVLYLSDELPWEMHHKAASERKAGKVLLQAWPNLSQEEKAKILNDTGFKHG
ncbi:MAG: hypothetical protein PSV35_00185 [bacterium]|nr:hypothetical protein [bacterium]